ncbi:homeobox-leucine zipper protein PROTODERMAL FACTOR 2-like [Lotus japonicus]|uniref:homeobox-leucine zipper protein PROTODERMAL FACTOR 2-like n=1 Tax=Lotus japonicus TaxID=34305 RepID=UPI0025848F03|nr:homeobox-leucine zipper protein PROTODERMAL FACTOR 2-like [Lotus japonicus]
MRRQKKKVFEHLISQDMQSSTLSVGPLASVDSGVVTIVGSIECVVERAANVWKVDCPIDFFVKAQRIMSILLNFETQQAEHDVSSLQQTPHASSQGDNGGNNDGNQQHVVATLHIEEEAPPSVDETQPPPTSGDDTQPILSMDFALQYMLELHENAFLMAKNEKLRAENLQYKEALRNAKHFRCGGSSSVGEMSFEEKHLRLENALLKEKIKKLREMTARIAKQSSTTSFSNLPLRLHTPISSRSSDVVNYVLQPSMAMQVHGGSSDPKRSIITTPFTESEKSLIMELVVGAMDEFTNMANSGPPLWIPEMNGDILNQQEYVKAFHAGLSRTRMGFRSEGSRESMMVIMNRNNLIEILMDVNQWSNVFPGIVSSARTTEIISTGVAGDYDGALQAISAEFQTLSHLVPARDTYFLRYCKHRPDGAWVVVDISLDDMRPGAATRCRRRPSGCMIQEFPNGLSKVTWIEHVEVEDREVHDIVKHLFNSGFAFGAKRWIKNLDRYCERLAFTKNTIIPQINGIASKERKTLMKLAEKIMQSYCNYVCASPPPHVWTVQTTPTGVDDVRVMTRNQIDASGALIGVVISVATSFSLPVPSKRLFDFLQNENSRNPWDILTKGFLVQELAHTESGIDPGKFISLLHTNSASSSQSNKTIVQETYTDSIGSYVVYSPVELSTMNLVLSGSDLDYGNLLPSGFAIIPDGSRLSGGPINDDGQGGCLGTLAYQILVEATPTPLAPSLVSSLCTLMKCTIDKIQVAMMSVST